MIRLGACRMMCGCAHCRHTEYVEFIFSSDTMRTPECKLQDKTRRITPAQDCFSGIPPNIRLRSLMPRRRPYAAILCPADTAQLDRVVQRV